MPSQRQAHTAAVTPIDVVIVSYNSRRYLREAVEPLASAAGVKVIIIDNASSDESIESVADLPIDSVAIGENLGFAKACNLGLERGTAPLVLFLNPDARIDEPSLRMLADVLERDSRVGAAAPRIHHIDGSLAHYQRRFPRLLSTYSRALYVDRFFPAAAWASAEVSTPAAYAATSSPEWVPAACLLTRRDAVERLGGFDEGFFMYCEDMDLCRRLRTAGYDIRYEPTAVCTHVGGASAPRARLLPVLAESRVRYALKHRSPIAAFAERIGVSLEGLTHALVTRRGPSARAGYAKASAQALRTSAPPRNPRMADSGQEA